MLLGIKAKMIDWIKIRLLDFQIAHELDGKTQSTDWHGLKFDPVIKAGMVKFWRSNLKNLQLVIRGDTLIITNSIHKFYHGNNYTDFYYSELKQAFADLSAVLDINILEAKVTSFEYGCNIRIDNPMQLIEKLKGYKCNSFNPMYEKSKIYGLKLDVNDYAIKFYDKQMEVKIHGKVKLDFGLLRYEKEVKYLRYIQKKGIPINRVCDLLKKDNLQKLADDLIETYKEIHKDPNVDLSKLGIEELKKYSVLQNKEVSKHLTKRSPRSIRSYRKDLESKVDPHFYQTIEQLITAKLNELIW